MTITKELTPEPLWYLKGLPYGDYLQTDHWKSTRNNFLSMYEGALACDRCGLDVLDQVSYARKYHYRPEGNTMVECRSDAQGAMETYDTWYEDRTPRFNVHHKTYERLGEERMEDLELLCSPCHNVEHYPDSHAAQWWKTYLDGVTNTRSLNGKAGER